MEHYLKIERPFADAVIDGRKRFETRRNDRGYNAGDTIRFHCVESGEEAPHEINGREYRIVYCQNGYGLREAYVAFGFEELTRKSRRKAESVGDVKSKSA